MGCWGAPRDWWRSSRSQSGGVLYDWGAHLVEYVFQVVDAEVVEVAGFAREGVWATSSPWKADTNEDESCAVARFRNGVWLILTVTQLDANPSAGIVQFKGTKGTYIMDRNQYEIVSPSLGGELVRVTGRNPESEGWRFYENLKEHFVDGKPLVITPEYARRIVHILELVQRSARKGRALRPHYG
ncbi:MAG: Gfo/Idh/MocA family protein [Kiritimatiellia bacterium]